MTASWPEPLQRQVKTLLGQFLRGDGSAWIGIASIGHLSVTGGLGTARLGGRLETLGSQPVTRAFVWVQDAEPELWVDPRDAGYRDLYEQFARQHLGLPGRPDGASFNIDHVFPKAAAGLDGMSHVRVLAIEAAGNQSAGRTLEKAMKQRGDSKPGRKIIRQATWMTLGKACGFVGWELLPDSEEAGNADVVARLFSHLAARGIYPPAGAVEAKLTAHSLGQIR